MKHRFLTLSDVARLGNVATSTAFSNVNELLDDRVIKENHRKGRKIYFAYNNLVVRLILRMRAVILDFECVHS